jgi:hypothetical protein
MLRRIVYVILIILLAATVIPAADLSGQWTGTMEKVKGGPAGPAVEEYHLTLQHNGDAITGAVGPKGANWEIQNAKLSGQRLSFETSVAGGKFLVAFELDVNGDELNGAMQSKRGPEITGKLHFKRQN